MGDGGLWHNGLTSGVAGAVFNQSDSVLVIMNNGYSSATGQQHIPSTGTNFRSEPTGQNIRDALKGLGVKWQRTVTTNEVGTMMKTLREALTTKTKGLKVIIAESECQLAKQRRIRPLLRKKLEQGERLIRTRFGVDDDVCTGDHSCIRLSGCPSLTIKPNPDPLRKDPVAHVDNGCVGCGLCGETAGRGDLVPKLLSRRYRAEPQRRRPLSRPLPPHGDRISARAPGGGMTAVANEPRPTTILIGALGGEGGGLLTNWLVAAAGAADLPVQSTSIPGVAQRTGATTYYLEIFPTPRPS